jgi:CHRD domain-containing protein
MRYVFLPAIFVLVGCADSAPTSTNEHATHARVAGPLSSAPTLAGVSVPTHVFNTELRAEQEPNNASTSESKGHAQVKVLENGTLEFVLTINNKSDETFNRAHIHKAPAGVNGPIHWDFLEAGVPVASIGGQPATLRGVAVARAAAVLSDLLANPDQYYVNVHSPTFPGGAIRGQLR